MTIAPPLTGQDINLAARATRQLLTEELETIGLPFDDWIVLNLIAAGQVVDEPELRGRLASGLGLEDRTIDDLLDRLVADGQVERRPGSIVLGPDGRSRWEQGNALTSELVAWIYDGLDPDDLAVTRRVLVEVTDRAERRRRG